ncbi:MAG: extracellular solute-binding protein, partial [Candidatus Saccharibacteria bacterium]|nr:extracellular solute-binding protein [Candidatus Saccharibacteria bacterium]
SPQQIGAGDEGAGFATGKFALTLTGNWNYQVFKTEYKDLNFDIIPNLTYKGKKSTMQFTVGWGEYVNTKSKDLADKWIQYVSGKEGMTTWTEGVGTLATRPDVADSTTALSENPLLRIHQDQIEYAIPWQDGVHLSTVVSSYGNFISDAFKEGSDKETLVKVLKEIDDDANSKISK